MPTPSFPQLNWRTSATTSDPISIAGITICGFYIPSGFSGTSVAFKVSDKIDGTFVNLCDETGNAISYTVGAGTYCRVKPSDFAGIACLQMVSGSSESANTQVKLSAREIS